MGRLPKVIDLSFFSKKPLTATSGAIILFGRHPVLPNHPPEGAWMKTLVIYWCESYEKETGWRHGQEVDLSKINIVELSKTYDVAIMNSRNNEVKMLAIDEKGKNFRKR